MMTASLKDDVLFVSTLIPTIGRLSLDRAVQSVLEQEVSADFEVIVVNDSGGELPAAGWQRSPRVWTVSTHRRERSVARNTGPALARGDYLHFLDDDDWPLPGAFRALKELADSSPVRWLYGGSQLVDRRGNKLIELHHAMAGNCALPVMAGEWIPLQSSLFEAELFFELGGFDPLIPGAEDIEFTRRAAVAAEVAGTEQLVACIGMGPEGSTTDYAGSRPLIREGREGVLDQRGVFMQLRARATSAYWSGRLVRLYLTSGLWNLRRRRATTAVSRLSWGLITLLLSGSHTLSPSFWQALIKPYRNDTFKRGFEQAGLA